LPLVLLPPRGTILALNSRANTSGIAMDAPVFAVAEVNFRRREFPVVRC